MVPKFSSTKELNQTGTRRIKCSNAATVQGVSPMQRVQVLGISVSYMLHLTVLLDQNEGRRYLRVQTVLRMY